MGFRARDEGFLGSRRVLLGCRGPEEPGFELGLQNFCVVSYICFHSIEKAF